MARKTSVFTKLINLIGLREEEDDRVQEKERPQRSAETRARYGATSSTSYGQAQPSRGRSYGSSGSPAHYADGYSAKKQSRSASMEEPDELAWDTAPTSRTPSKVAHAQRTAAQEAPARRRTATGQSAQIVSYHLQSLEGCRQVINSLLDGNTIFLNLEDMDDRIIQRTIDTIAGAAFALDAKFSCMGERIYLVAPTSVRFSGDNLAEFR